MKFIKGLILFSLLLKLYRDSASHEGIVSNGAIELVDSGAPTDDASIKALMAQNTTLRSSIAQLRKKNAEVRYSFSTILTLYS